MKELSQKLERLIETAVEKEEIAGANIVVIRDGKEQTIASTELVPGDLMLICEGVKIPADGNYFALRRSLRG